MTYKPLVLLRVLALAGLALFLPSSAPAGGVAPATGYKVLEPIRQGNHTIPRILLPWTKGCVLERSS
jgi:hypothetical protein